MKKMILVAFLVAAIGAAAFAQGAPRGGTFGAQVAGTITSVTANPIGALGFKYMITDAIGIRAMLGFLNTSNPSSTVYDLLGGFEYHFAGKGGVSPYLGVQVGYSGESVSGGGNTPSDFGLRAVFGADYYFSSNFAWGGEMMLGYDSFTNTTPATTTALFTGVSTVLTWYLN